MIIITIDRLFIPLYFRMCPENLFKFEPTPYFGMLVIFLNLLQIFIMMVQKIFGGKAILPKFLRPKSYNYYRNLDEIKTTNIDMENATCSICLLPLVASEEKKTEDYFQDPKDTVTNKISIFRKCFSKCSLTKKEKPFMMTPCNHIFHSSCLKPWHDKKQDCPMCRLSLPLID